MKSIPEQDSLITITKKQFQYSTRALIDLKATKIENYLFNERLRNKDISISYYEKLYKKCNLSDSLNSLLLLNKNTEIEIVTNLYKEEKRERRIQQTQKVVLAVVTPLGIIGGFVLGWFLHK